MAPKILQLGTRECAEPAPVGEGTQRSQAALHAPGCGCLMAAPLQPAASESPFTLKESGVLHKGQELKDIAFPLCCPGALKEKAKFKA